MLAFLIRFGAALAWQWKALEEKQLFRFGDSDSYWTIARNFVQFGRFEYGGPDSQVFRAPLYPFYLTLFSTIENSQVAVLAARTGNALLGTLVVALIFAIAYRTGLRWGAFFAALLAALYPGAIGMSIFVLSEALFCPLMLLSLLLLLRKKTPPLTHCTQQESERNAVCHPRAMSFFWAGIASGLACLTRPSWLLFIFPLFCYLYFDSNTWKIWIKRCVIFITALSLTMSPWWLRNYRVTGTFVPTTLQVGASLYDSFYDVETGASTANMAFVDGFVAEQRSEDQTASKPLVGTFEWRLDQRMRAAALAKIRGDFSAVFRLGLLKFARTWSPFPNASQTSNPWIGRAEALGYIVILGISIVATGIALLWRHDQIRLILFLFLPAIYFGVLHSFFVGSIRYRHPAMLLLCVSAAYGIVWIWPPNKSANASSA